MNLEVLENILDKKQITIKDRIKFNKIIDVLNSLFIDKNRQSVIEVGYKLNNKQYLWFPNIALDSKKEQIINEGYGNFLSQDWDYIYQYNSQKETDKRLKDIKKKKKKEEEDVNYITFAKINDKSKGIGYHFIGIFKFDSCQDDEGKTIIYKKVKDSFEWNW